MMKIIGDGSSYGIKGELEILTKDGALKLISDLQERIDEGDFDE